VRDGAVKTLPIHRSGAFHSRFQLVWVNFTVNVAIVQVIGLV